MSSRRHSGPILALLVQHKVLAAGTRGWTTDEDAKSVAKNQEQANLLEVARRTEDGVRLMGVVEIRVIQGCVQGGARQHRAAGIHLNSRKV